MQCDQKGNFVHLLKDWGLDKCNITDEPRGCVLNERSQTEMDEDRVARGPWSRQMHRARRIQDVTRDWAKRIRESYVNGYRASV